MLEELSTPAEDIEYMTPIPEEVKVQNCELFGGILEVDFSGEYLDMGNIREKLMRARSCSRWCVLTGKCSRFYSGRKTPDG